MDWVRLFHKFRLQTVKVIAPKLSVYINEVRPMIKYVKSMGGTQLVGVEIGVAEGVNAENILKTLSIARLFLIDPYIPYFDRYSRIPEPFLPLAKKRLEKYSDKIVFIKKPSKEAKKLVPNCLDFVYIDGNHSYDFVKEDIEMYYPKVRKGGVIGGHDFITAKIGVCRAVIEFVCEHELELHGVASDWWIKK